MTQEANSNAGGKATAAGMSFQSRVAAYYSVAILSESEADPPFGLPTSSTLDFIRFETGQPVDDLLIGHSAGHIFVQAKRSLNLSSAAESPLYSIADQFVRQYLANRQQADPARPWTAPLDLQRDRLVAAIGPTSAGSVRVSLATALDSVRRLISHQPLSDAASNQDEKRALQVFADDLRAAWLGAMGVAPSDSELRYLLSLVNICTLSVESGGSDENIAKDRLRRSVLAIPSEVNAAWDCLIRHAIDLAAHGGGATRSDLQQALVAAGLAVKVPRSYEADIQRLRESTSRSLQLLESLSYIRVGEHRIHLERASSRRLFEAALHDSVLVVGEPGAGKSGCIRDLCIDAQRTGHDVVLLLVDRLDTHGGNSLGAALGLSHDIVDVLNSWPSNEPGLLVFDALDAARDERMSRRVRDAIVVLQKSSSRWRVVASIRKFDLRYSAELAAMFPGAGVQPYIDREFSSIAHLDVPRLSEDELLVVRDQSPKLAGLLDVAPRPLQDLLRIPFNLRLAGELVGDGLSNGVLSPVKSQLGLLDRYWQQRVLSGGHTGEDHERVLREVCEQMVVSRTLQAERGSLTTSSMALRELLSRNVLAEWQPQPAVRPDRYRIGFSHHVLFDYAVSRLLLRVSEASLLARVRTTPDFVLVARPSLDIHFRHLWESDRDGFWSLTFSLLREPNVPRIAGLVGPSVVAGAASNVSELSPLIDAIRTPATAAVGASALRHIVTFLLAMGTKIAGTEGGPWCSLAQLLVSNVSHEIVGPLRVLVARAVDFDKELIADQRFSVNVTAEGLLRFAWQVESTNSVLAGVALQAVCRTFSSRPVASGDLLRDVIRPPRLAQRGYLDLPGLTGELDSLFGNDPSLVADIYSGAFSYEDRSQEPTPLGRSSQILSLVSHRAQDYRQALWLLADTFPRFLQSAPTEAVRAALTVVEHYIQREGFAPHHESDVDQTFLYRGKTVRYKHDESAIWDVDSTRDHDEPVRILNSLYEHLGTLADQGDRETLETCIDAITTNALSAVTWRRLIASATDKGGLLRDAVWDLCLSLPVLIGFDTSDAVGRFLSAHFAGLSREQRGAIEDAILSIPYKDIGKSDDRRDRIRARLLGCLPDADIVHREARDILQALRAGAGIPSNDPPFQLSTFRGRQYTTEDWLRDMGVAVDESPNRLILDLLAPVRDFASAPAGSVLRKDVLDLIPQLQALRVAIQSDQSDGAHETTRNAAWGYIAGACNRAASADEISSSHEPRATLRALLLEASTNVQPAFDASIDTQFESSPSWGSPAARIDAASGLLLLSQGTSAVQADVIEAIARLSCDRVSAVRFQVATYLRALFRTNPEFVWTTATQMVAADRSQTVLQSLITSTLGPLAGLATERAASLVLKILERFQDKEPRHDCRRTAIAFLLELYLYSDNADARRFVLAAAERVGTAPSDAHDLIAPARDALTYGSDQTDAPIRRRTFELMTSLVRRSVSSFRDIENQQMATGATEWPESVRAHAKAVAEVAVDVSEQVYFGSGAFEMKRSHDGPGNLRSPDIRKRFYSEATDLLDSLVTIGLVPSAHYLIETFESFIEIDPRGVFLKIAATVRSSSSHGYPQESRAADLVVQIVQRYLADYRSLLRDDSECRSALLELLDVFVEAGWTTASSLTYKLEDLFR